MHILIGSATRISTPVGEPKRWTWATSGVTLGCEARGLLRERPGSGAVVGLADVEEGSDRVVAPVPDHVRAGVVVENGGVVEFR